VHTFITIFGFVSIVLAVLWFAFKLYVAVDAARCPLGAGGVPTLDGALFPPFALALGLWAIRLGHPDWPRPSLLLVWFVATAFGFAVHFAIARFVRRQTMPPTKKTDENHVA
jgi:hypothetical protein